MIFGRNTPRIEFACFIFHVGLLSLSTFRLSNWMPKNNANFDAISTCQH